MDFLDPVGCLFCPLCGTSLNEVIEEAFPVEDFGNLKETRDTTVCPNCEVCWDIKRTSKRMTVVGTEEPSK